MTQYFGKDNFLTFEAASPVLQSLFLLVAVEMGAKCEEWLVFHVGWWQSGQLKRKPLLVNF